MTHPTETKRTKTESKSTVIGPQQQETKQLPPAGLQHQLAKPAVVAGKSLSRAFRRMSKSNVRQMPTTSTHGCTRHSKDTPARCSTWTFPGTGSTWQRVLKVSWVFFSLSSLFWFVLSAKKKLCESGKVLPAWTIYDIFLWRTSTNTWSLLIKQLYELFHKVILGKFCHYSRAKVVNCESRNDRRARALLFGTRNEHVWIWEETRNRSTILAQTGHNHTFKISVNFVRVLFAIQSEG